MLRIVENFKGNPCFTLELIKNYTFRKTSTGMATRLEVLIQYYKEEPHDPFNIYALATEYQKTDFHKAAQLFEELLLQHESYVPTYYHAAKLFAEIGDRDKAIQTYEKGIAIATQLGETKALRELKSAYDELMFD